MKTINTQTKDGLILNGQLFESSDKENIIINIHGMAGDLYLNSFYPLMQQIYPPNGYSFLATENRGTHSITQFNTVDGDTRNIGNAYEIFEESKYDIQGWIDKAMDMGYKNIWLQGHSLGPSKIGYYISQTKDRSNIKGLILLSPSDMLGLVKDSEGRKDHEICFKQAKEFVSNGESTRLLDHMLWGCYILSANTYINFFGEESNTGIFNYKGNNWDVVNGIDIPVIAFTGTKDDGIVPVIDPYEAMKKLEGELLKSPKKKTVVFKDAQHDFEGYGEDIVEEVLTFIN